MHSATPQLRRWLDQPDDLQPARERLDGEVAGLIDAHAEELVVLLALCPRRRQHLVGDLQRLGERALDRLLVARVLGYGVAQEARAERNVAVLVARDEVEAAHEAG